MPDDPSGVYSLPSGYRATDGEVALASQHNPPLEDIATALTSRFLRSGVAPMLGNLAMNGNKITGLDPGAASTDAVNKAQMDAAVSASAIPSGAVSAFAGASAPSGWLLCNGQAVSRTTYAALFSVVSVIYGSGDGSTTFNVPDLRGEFVRGLDGGRGVDAGRTLGSAQSDTLKSHTHTATSTVADPGHNHGTGAKNTDYPNAGGNNIPNPESIPRFGATASATTGITVSTDITATGGAETRPRNVALNFIIKT